MTSWPWAVTCLVPLYLFALHGLVCCVWPSCDMGHWLETNKIPLRRLPILLLLLPNLPKHIDHRQTKRPWQQHCLPYGMPALPVSVVTHTIPSCNTFPPYSHKSFMYSILLYLPTLCSSWKDGGTCSLNRAKQCLQPYIPLSSSFLGGCVWRDGTSSCAP